MLERDWRLITISILVSRYSNLIPPIKYFKGAKNCITANCIMRGKNFADGWVTSYNVIGNDVTELIPGITNPEVCQSLCQLVDSCSHWTLDQDDQGTVIIIKSKFNSYPRTNQNFGIINIDSAVLFRYTSGRKSHNLRLEISGGTLGAQIDN